jgi:hypothetical protein
MMEDIAEGCKGFPWVADTHPSPDPLSSTTVPLGAAAPLQHQISRLVESGSHVTTHNETYIIISISCNGLPPRPIIV